VTITGGTDCNPGQQLTEGPGGAAPAGESMAGAVCHRWACRIGGPTAVGSACGGGGGADRGARCGVAATAAGCDALVVAAGGKELGLSNVTVAKVWQKWDIHPWRTETFKFSTDPELATR
jgi:hypothetical protein